MRIPKKPFPTYKWRWAVYTPTESLNSPPVYLGILRVLRANEFGKFSSEKVNDGLRLVQQETDSSVNLVRSADRNIFRNSGQYWRGLGMLDEGKKGEIVLSDFGRELADGNISQVEFATTVLTTLELPNRRIESDIAEWDLVGLRFRPFEIILRVICDLQAQFGIRESYISVEELIGIIIPLAGDNGLPDEYVEAISLYRQNKLDLSHWPNCAPEANDKRMAREYMLFLEYYGLCSKVVDDVNLKERYALSSISVNEIIDLFSMEIRETELILIEKIIRRSEIPTNIERKRVAREVLERPNQSMFRKLILEAYGSTCLITGVRMETVLEAAHIRPVKYQGLDHIVNGFCMRADIHTLYDSNHLRIHANGDLILSDEARQKENYSHVPTQIALPSFVDLAQIDWRFKYY